MADSNFTFHANFNEFLPVYRDVTNVWVGDGVNTGSAGMLYAQYADGSIVELGYVTLYNIAASNDYGFTGTAGEWTQAIIDLAAMNKGATVSIMYQNSTDGVNHPGADLGWSSTPNPEKGKYMWAKITLSWAMANNLTSTYYTVSYEGNDNSITSVNGMSNGAIVLTAEDIKITGQSNQNVKQYVDSFVPETATNAEIDALFGIEPENT